MQLSSKAFKWGIEDMQAEVFIVGAVLQGVTTAC